MTTPRNPNRVSWIDGAPRPLCDVPWLGTSIVLSDGSVNFCCFSSDATVGNVNDEPLEKIWNGKVMREIRRSLTEQKLPPQCQCSSCPIYRGDELNYLIRRMRGDHDFVTTGTHDPHAHVRERLRGSKLRVIEKHLHTSETIELTLELQYRGEPMSADLFVAVRTPDRTCRFFSNGKDYAAPFLSAIELSEDNAPLHFEAYGQAEWFRLAGDYEVCAALFEKESNPNLLSNCYWSAVTSFVNTNLAVRLAEFRRKIA